MSPWLILVVAGLLEAGWALGLKSTAGFTRPVASVVVGAAIVASLALLGIATRDLPIGTAYAVWVGIGALGAFVGGVALFGEALTLARAGFALLLLVAIVGLKMTAQPPAG
ncbi:MAG: hypothetical protein CVU56_01750 [Deltaproteobacteria bacterium HGW-Deltaproteobacteria-14]|jgi:quaternary ammonium compound-resistance protein SugE|nr:MAG: hypothetical protein CVU56_01750 [Deltaproteobacteria bacterium HGW-Deltaproteobacteria-14]